jgi:hypothetical protein
MNQRWHWDEDSEMALQQISLVGIIGSDKNDVKLHFDCTCKILCID